MSCLAGYVKPFKKKIIIKNNIHEIVKNQYHKRPAEEQISLSETTQKMHLGWMPVVVVGWWVGWGGE